MYTPEHFAAGPADIQELLGRPGAANLVTATAGGLLATLLPFTHDPSIGEHGALHMHVARNNSQWAEAVLGEALAIVQGADAYISPSWYAAKAEHGRVVPTWNYLTAHVYGELVIHEDPDWLMQQVGALSNLNEADKERPWRVEDAPARYVAGQLRAIVGVELVITRIEAKAKLSQNRPANDIPTLVEGLRGHGEHTMAALVANGRQGGVPGVVL